MAVINSNAIGSARNKSGELVYYVRRGQTIARAYQPNPHDPATISQENYRNRYSFWRSAWSLASTIIQFNYKNKNPLITQFNLFMKYNIPLYDVSRYGDRPYDDPWDNITGESKGFVSSVGNLPACTYPLSNPNSARRVTLPVFNMRDYQNIEVRWCSIMLPALGGVSVRQGSVMCDYQTYKSAGFVTVPSTGQAGVQQYFVFMRTTDNLFVSSSMSVVLNF